MIGVTFGCVLLTLVLRGAVVDSGLLRAVDKFWRNVVAKDLVAVTACLSPASDIDASAIVEKYSGYLYKGPLKVVSKVEGDIAVVPVELESPSGYAVSVLTIMQRHGRDWRVRSTNTSR